VVSGCGFLKCGEVFCVLQLDRTDFLEDSHFFVVPCEGPSHQKDSPHSHEKGKNGDDELSATADASASVTVVVLEQHKYSRYIGFSLHIQRIKSYQADMLSRVDFVIRFCAWPVCFCHCTG